MKNLPILKSTLTLLALSACGVRSTAPEQQGLGSLFGDAGSGDAARPVSSTDAGDATLANDAATETLADATSEDAAPIEAGAPDHMRDASTNETSTPARPKARGFYVVSLTYDDSLSVGALGLDGTVLSKSLISSGSDIPGLSLGLGTDAIPPTQVQTGDDIVLIDRTNHAIDSLSLETAKITSQLGVGQGYASNPYDYLVVQPELAFASRIETNGAPGLTEYDEGGDLLAVNPKTSELLGRVDFNYLTKDVPDLQPRPTKMLEYGGLIYTVLGMLTTGWEPVVSSVLAVVDPASFEVTATLDLGLRNCEDITLQPGGSRAAIGCKGGWADEPITLNSGIVVVDLAPETPEVVATYGAAELAGAQVSALAFASETQVLFSSYGSFDPELNDRVMVLNLVDETVSDSVLETSPFKLGSIRCVPERELCVIANADNLSVEFLDVTPAGVNYKQSVIVDESSALPPTYIGVF